jgi:hypothetical protein
MRERILPAWAIGLGAEFRARTDKLPINEPYLVDVTELLRAISEKELAECRRRRGYEESAIQSAQSPAAGAHR